MSEIAKLYENAGIKADRIVCYRGFDNCIDNDFNCHCHNEKPCNDATVKSTRQTICREFIKETHDYINCNTKNLDEITKMIKEQTNEK